MIKVVVFFVICTTCVWGHYLVAAEDSEGAADSSGIVPIDITPSNGTTDSSYDGSFADTLDSQDNSTADDTSDSIDTVGNDDIALNDDVDPTNTTAPSDTVDAKEDTSTNIDAGSDDNTPSNGTGASNENTSADGYTIPLNGALPAFDSIATDDATNANATSSDTPAAYDQTYNSNSTAQNGTIAPNENTNGDGSVPLSDIVGSSDSTATNSTVPTNDATAANVGTASDSNIPSNGTVASNDNVSADGTQALNGTIPSSDTVATNEGIAANVDATSSDTAAANGTVPSNATTYNSDSTDASSIKEEPSTSEAPTTTAAIKRTADYCAEELCPGKKHIACENNGDFASSCSSDCALVDITDYQSYIVEEHNRYRSKIACGEVDGFDPAVRMATMLWDDELAELACLNVKQCQMKHDACRNTDRFTMSGQNLAWHWASNPTPVNASIHAGIDGWFKESKDASMKYIDSYQYSKITIGHFTAMVVDISNRLGCCVLQQSKKGGYEAFMACNYALTNMMDYPIYVKGLTASKCTTGVNPDYKGLCSEAEPIDPNDYERENLLGSGTNDD